MCSAIALSCDTGDRPSRYESQKRRDWNTFLQYLKNHRPPLELPRCSGAHVLEFLRYLDQFGKTKVHSSSCPFFGQPCPPSPCPCPLRQAWGSLDALVGRLRAAFEENGGHPDVNPFGVRAVRLFLRDVRDSQAKARGIAYEKKKRKRPPVVVAPQPETVAVEGSGGAPVCYGGGGGEVNSGSVDVFSYHNYGDYLNDNHHHHHHHHYNYGNYHHYMMVGSGNEGDGGSGGGEVVMAVMDGRSGSATGVFMPLSVFH